MTTKTRCVQGAKGIKKSLDYVIVHTPGHVDDTKVATDRGFTLLPINEVWNFGAVIDAYYTVGGKLLEWALADAAMKAYGPR